ncbi:MAG TPA: glycosyltransferase family 4 protein, partial [bacterium]|nr:glycosyltransferase family 4 protein [bacterium]
VADYSERLLPRLAQFFDIHLYGHTTPPVSNQIQTMFQWFPRRMFELQNRRTPYDLNIYHLGNSHIHQFVYPMLARYPGAVVLHDANVHHARAYSHLGHRNLNDYLDELEWCHGEEGRRIGPAMAHGFHSPVLYDRFPMLDIACRNARGVMVHNRFARDRLQGIVPDHRIFRVDLPYYDWALPDPETAREALGIDRDRLVLGTFGFLTPGKGLRSILEAFRSFHADNPRSFCVLVGGSLEDSFETWLHREMETLPDVFQTGYVTDQTFQQWLAAVDIGICLRYPTQGESSDALLRVMGAGKPVIVPDYRQFREIPGDACVRIPIYPNESYAVLSALRMLAREPETAATIGEAARKHVLACNQGEQWIASFVHAVEKILSLESPEPLGRSCPLRHVRVAPVMESVVQAVKDWGDIAKDPLIIDPLAGFMEELGLDE